MSFAAEEGGRDMILLLFVIIAAGCAVYAVVCLIGIIITLILSAFGAFDYRGPTEERRPHQEYE
jgi:ABC-type phosphate transport system permease subunit